jgi:hypothetical protein
MLRQYVPTQVAAGSAQAEEKLIQLGPLEINLLQDKIHSRGGACESRRVVRPEQGTVNQDPRKLPHQLV